MHPSMSRRTIRIRDAGVERRGRGLRLRRCGRVAVEQKLDARTDLPRKYPSHLRDHFRPIATKLELYTTFSWLISTFIDIQTLAPPSDPHPHPRREVCVS